MLSVGALKYRIALGSCGVVVLCTLYVARPAAQSNASGDSVTSRTENLATKHCIRPVSDAMCLPKLTTTFSLTTHLSPEPSTLHDLWHGSSRHVERVQAGLVGGELRQSVGSSPVPRGGHHVRLVDFHHALRERVVEHWAADGHSTGSRRQLVE